MYRFSPLALQHLHDAGWTEDRRIDISDYERKVKDVGFELFPCVREFLQRFGNLEFMRKRRVVKRPGWAPFGIQVMPVTWSETTDDWFDTTLIDHDPHWNEYRDDSIDSSLQRIGSLTIQPRGCEVAADKDGRVYRTGEGLLELLGASIYEGMEAVLTDRPSIDSWWGEKKDWRKLGKADEWREFVKRTGIVLPDDVIDLLIPEAQEAIREAARR